MDNDVTEEILNKTKLRNREIEELLGEESTVERPVAKERIGSSGACSVIGTNSIVELPEMGCPLKPLTNITPEKPRTPGRSSRFAALSAKVDQFECDLRPAECARKKENLLKGPPIRVSMGGETRASVLFVPSVTGSGSSPFGERIETSPLKKESSVHVPNQEIHAFKPNASTRFLFIEEADGTQNTSPRPILNPKNSAEPVVVEEWEESPKTKHTPPAQMEKKVETTSVKAIRDRWEIRCLAEKASQISDDKDKSMVESPQIRPLKPLTYANRIATPEKPHIVGRSSRFAALSAEVDRFECDLTPAVNQAAIVSSESGTPLHTREKTEKASQFSENKVDVVDQNEIISSATADIATSECVEKTPYASDVYRPITPNSELLGSLMDDINKDLEKYRTPKGSYSTLGPNSFKGLDANNDGLTHTISSYRKQAKRARIPDYMLDGMENSMSPKANLEASTSSMDKSDASTAPPDMPNNDATVKRLTEAIIVQQDQICQASRALAFCRQNNNFRGSREEIDAQRALLIATERRRAFVLERDRVMNAKTTALSSGPRGTLTFSSIGLKISRDFINMYVRQHSDCHRYYFIVLIKNGETVLHTTLANSDHGVKTGIIEFSHYIQLSGLAIDFICTVEVYSLRTSSEADAHDKSKKQSTWKRMVKTPSGINTSSNISATFSGSSSRPMGVLDPGFQKVGHVTLNRSHIERTKFHLIDSAYPLDGEMILHMRCFAEEVGSTNYRGFLSLYQLVSGLGSWTRFWCILSDGQMRFWRYPEDEEKKDPSVMLDLKNCLTGVSEVPSSVASFQHSMHVDVAVGEDGAPKEEIRMLMAADTLEAKETWMEAINTALRYVSAWSSSNKK